MFKPKGLTDLIFQVGSNNKLSSRSMFLKDGEQRKPCLTASSPVRVRAHINVHHSQHRGTFHFYSSTSPVITTHVYSTTQGNVSVCSPPWQGVPQSLVPGPFPASGSMSFVGGGWNPSQNGVAPQRGQGVPPFPCQEGEWCYAVGGTPLSVTQEDFLVCVVSPVTIVSIHTEHLSVMFAFKIGVFPMCFYWIHRIQWPQKSIIERNCCIRTCYLLCKTQRCYHSARRAHVAERIFRLTPIHASAIYQNP